MRWQLSKVFTLEKDEMREFRLGCSKEINFSFAKYLCIEYFYRPRMRVGKGFTPVCLSVCARVCVCVCIRVITFEPLDLLA